MRRRSVVGAGAAVLLLGAAGVSAVGEDEREGPRARPGVSGASPRVATPADRPLIDVVSQPTNVCTDGFGSLAVFATNSVDLNQGSDVLSGSVAVNDASPGPTLGCGGRELCVGIGVTTPAGFEVRADEIQVKRNGLILGDAFCNELTNGGGDPNLTCASLTLPVFGELPPFLAAPPRPDAPDVFVAQGGSVILGPGDYGVIDVNQNGSVLFTGGVYNVREIDFGLTTTFEFASPSEVRVEGKLSIDQGSYVGPAVGSGVTAADIVFYVAGINGANGNLGATPKAAKIGINATALANFYVPNGTLQLRQNTNATGAFLARDVHVGIGAQVALDSHFGNQPPTAVPLSILTNGTEPVEITLEGSDPEVNDLTFDIEVSPNEGTLGAIEPIVPDPVPEIDRETGLPTGNFVQPPITQATVAYTADTAGNLEDFFTYSATDVCGEKGLAVVDINPFDATPPPPEPEIIDAVDVSTETVTDTSVELALIAVAPTGTTLDFSVLTLPQGSLTDALGNEVGGVPYLLPSSSVFYLPPPGFTGNDGFQWEAADSSGELAADTASASVDVGPLPELAPDQQVETPLNQPLQVTLFGNPGGSGSGGSSSIVRIPARTISSNGAAVAGNVSDADGDGFGDGRDDLPGPAPVLVAAGVDVNLGGGGSTVVDFETPPLGAADRQLADPYSDSGITFTVAAAGFVGGLVKNVGTSACVDPPSADQNYGVGTDAASIGFSSSPITATFANALSPGTPVSATFQTADGTPIRLRLFDAAGSLVASTTSTAGPPAGQCGLPGPARAITTISASAPNDSVASAVLDLDTATGGVVFVIDDFTVGTGGVSGTARIQVEWDLAGLGLEFPEDIESAEVLLTTEKGTVDDLDTFFFSGDSDQDGLLRVTDYEAPGSVIAGVVMPVPPGAQTGDEGTFTFDVTGELRAAISAGFGFFSIQARVDEELAGGGFRRGLQVRSTADGNLIADKHPQLVIDTGAVAQPLRWTVTSLPTRGTLTTLTGTPVLAGQTFTFEPTLLYTPNLGFSGLDTVVYEVAEGAVVDTALLDILVALNDDCIFNGRLPGCSPPGP